MHASGGTRQRFPPHTPPSLRWAGVQTTKPVGDHKKKHHPSGWCFLFGMSRAGLNLLPRPARSALNQEVRQGSCEWLCHSWDAGSESSLVARSKKKTPSVRMVFSFWSGRFCCAKSVACGRVIEREWGNPSKGPSPRQVPPLRVGCAPKRALRGAALTLPLPCGGRECRQQNLWAVTKRNTIRQDGVFFLECRGRVIARERGIAAHFRRSS